MKNRSSRKQFRNHVPPRDVINDDFRELTSRVTMRTSWDVQHIVLIDSVTSHAHMGHGIFHGRQFRNTTEDDVVRALRMNPDIVKSDRQALIDEIKDYIDRTVAGKTDNALSNADGEPLFRVGTFRYLQVDPKGVLQGLYLGGLRDDPSIRLETERCYGAQIGSGQIYPVNKQVMHEMGLTGDVLAHEGHANRLRKFRENGLIVEHPNEDTVSMFIRHTGGPGQSDDAAIVIAGKLYGLSAAVGTFLADAVDTIEKFAGHNGNQDGQLARYIETVYPDLGLTRDDAYRLTFLAAIPRELKGKIPDSSLRGLLEIDRKYDLCAFESHLLYVMNRPMPEIDLDHGEATNLEFYDYVEERLLKE